MGIYGCAAVHPSPCASTTTISTSTCSACPAPAPLRLTLATPSPIHEPPCLDLHYDGHHHHRELPREHHHHVPRGFLCRSLLASVLVGALAIPDAACAVSLSISGPKEWLKGQKKKTADYLLAPINASRDRLRNAISLSETFAADDLAEAHKLVKVAARDCIRPEEGSLVSFQVKTGVEVCTFRLILKNAASLLDDFDPAKVSADRALNDLISSFASLNEILTAASTGNALKREVAEAFSQTNNDLDKFEEGVRGCLGIS